MDSDHEMMMELLMQDEADVVADQEQRMVVDGGFDSPAQHRPSLGWFKGREGEELESSSTTSCLSQIAPNYGGSRRFRNAQ
jgi:hypothetical protein